MTTTSELRNQIENKGAEISQIAHQIEGRIESYVDWKGMVQERPIESIGIAVGAGLVLSGAAGPLLRIVGHQVGVIAKGSAIAFVMGLIQNKTSTARI